ncbi:thioesterase II family protein [Streptomyces ipomoeae]|uniref:thioesterase II family protein n=1 Tax=Streptomyces ipomoeae TaxID=103232 RepID=UPI0011470ABA|nr:alpha/beta fold hydrolase [Streptomyces ipomoeae]MDX2939098.1 alpha/beta fold hydrolase [Streptomyces ipomoeae]TQE30888.1 thioesterase [Streptomyces ipomoeae]
MTGVTTRSAARGWLGDRPSRAVRPRLRLLCFPHAGAGASAYQSWAPGLPDRVEVLPVRLPGREARADERPYTEVAELTSDLAGDLEPLWREPYVLFGHSMGALLAFELARELRRRGLPGPRRLIVSGRMAPQLHPDPRQRWRGLGDVELLDEIGRLGGMPDPLLLMGPAMLSVFLRPLRADIELHESYTYRHEPPLETPLTVLGGDRDPRADREELFAWRTQSSAGTDVHVMDGGHFFVTERRLAVLGLVRTALTPFID